MSEQTPAPQTSAQAMFAQWFDQYRSDKDPSIMPARSVAQAAFMAGIGAAEIDRIVIEERVRTERNDLADYLRRVLRDMPAGLDADVDAARAYLRQIGAA